MSNVNVRKDGKRPRILAEKDQEREDRREFREFVRETYGPMRAILFPDGNYHIVGGWRAR